MSLASLANELQLTVVGPLAGGEFGATEVRSPEGRRLVLKLFGNPGLEADVSEGLRLAGNLRNSGYPAPEYAGRGLFEGQVWTLQELMPGAVPEVMTPGHADQLLRLAARHAGAAGASRAWVPIALRFIRGWAEGARHHPVTARLGRELEHVAIRNASAPIRMTDVMHSDFHHRNFLAEGERVTGVFDWELASVGDWRFDVVTLGFWSAIPRGQVPEETGNLVLARMFEVCEPQVLAFFAAIQALRHITFDLTAHPDRLERIVDGIETAVAPWWREGN
jgi:hypothetical protein